MAIPLPVELQASIAAIQRELKTLISGVHWTAPEAIHLTLHFFGMASQETLEKIRVSMLSVKRSQRSFRVTIKGLGAFPSLRKPRVLWLGIEPEAPLQQLYKNCKTNLSSCGVTIEDRPFSPHLTIGRLKQPRADLSFLGKRYELAVAGKLTVTQLVLYESQLRPEGAKHHPLLVTDFNA